MNPWLLSLVCAYLLGSIPFGYLLIRIFRHQDIRDSGSGNTGATNVVRSGAYGLGLATLLLDLGKAALAVMLGFYLAQRAGLVPNTAYNLAVCTACVAILGHVYPVWLAFRGGKGVASAFGVFLALAPKASLGILLVFFLVVAFTRYVSLASILAAVSFPFFAFSFDRHPSHIVLFGFLFIPALIVWKHRANIRRLLAGTESRFGSKTQDNKPNSTPTEVSA